jgi:hypothetical protein
VVVGIDPGIRNAGLRVGRVRPGSVAYVFHEGLLQDKTAVYVSAFVRAVNQRYGGSRNVSYVIDPAAKQRAQANGMTVLSEINKAGVPEPGAERP